MKIGKEDYILMGPFASLMNKVDDFLTSKSSCKRKRKSRSKSKCPSKKQKKKKLKRKRKCDESSAKENEDSRPGDSKEILPENKESKCKENDSSIDRTESFSSNETQDSSEKQSRRRVKKLKSSKKKRRLTEKSECGCGRTHDNNQVFLIFLIYLHFKLLPFTVVIIPT